MRKERVSENVIKRLPKYYRCLKELEDCGEKKVSSTTISEMLGFTASQVRQDLSNFGGFGQQGYGYDVGYLKQNINYILGLDKPHNMVILGGGRIGQALANYTGFDVEGFHVLAVFDVQTAHISVRDGVQVLPISALADFLKSNAVEIAVIATQKESAEEVAAKAVELGVRSLWNFAPVDLSFGEDVAVENINMSESLYMLAYKNKNLL